MVYCVSTSTYYDVSILCHDVIIYSNNIHIYCGYYYCYTYLYIYIVLSIISAISVKRSYKKKHHPVDLNAVIDPQTPPRLGSRERNPMELIMSAMGFP